ncbi:MAG: AMP-binding protein [Bacillota bacterium]|nr:AMP-binding protein [Bacillota bacterium]
MFKLLYTLFSAKLLSPLGLYSLIAALYSCGFNIMALLAFAARIYGNQVALVEGDKTISYTELCDQSKKLAITLKEKYQLKSSQKIGFLCRNHAAMIKAIFAVSQLGADIYLLNIEMSKHQFNSLLDCYDFSLLIYDVELSSLVEQSCYNNEKIMSYHNSMPAINNLLARNVSEEIRLDRNSASKILLLTGGTTGIFKVAAHKPSVFNFLNPFFALITKLNLLKYHTAYIATPIYHGYGIALLFSFFALGKKVVIHSGFDADYACSLIRVHNIEVVAVVPLMIYKMLEYNAEDLKSLACIASGGAALNQKLVGEIFSKLGDVIYNLYGTSEAGLNIIATPEDLKYSANTIGKKINGSHLKILDENKDEVQVGKVGQICIKNKWSMINRLNPWIETGDLSYQDNKGYYYLCGRIDDMIVSAGENVYPMDIERVLINHPLIKEVAVIGMRDEKFGHRLKAFVLPVNNNLTEEELFDWLRPRVARFQLPKEIIFLEKMPYTPLGKLDKKQLNQY